MYGSANVYYHINITSNINTLSTIGSSPFITTPLINSNLSSITAHVDCSATPTNIDSTSLYFNIMQLNCNGLRDKLQEILRFMQIYNVLVAALQESKISKLCSLTAPGYNIVSKDRMSEEETLPSLYIIPFNTVWHLYLHPLFMTLY